MSEQVVEVCGGGTLEGYRESRSHAVDRAPSWVRERFNRTGGNSRPRGSARPSGSPPAARRIAGWLAGVACPGWSTPAYSKRDDRELPEQFTDNAIAGFVAQWRRGEEIPLVWKHGGPRLAYRALDLGFRQNSLIGLEFVARLEDSRLARLVLEQLEGRGCAVSIGYHTASAKQWLVERDGMGTVRVIDSARLHHIALIPNNAKMEPAYRGARAFGISGPRLGCPPEIRSKARLYAFEVIKRQANQLAEAQSKAAAR